jgi:hypothetical protein
MVIRTAQAGQIAGAEQGQQQGNCADKEEREPPRDSSQKAAQRHTDNLRHS